MSEDIPWAPGGLKAGSRLAGYLLEEQVGRGGMAVVYRAYDDRLDRRVALKVLAPDLVRDEAFRRRFIQESRAAAAVDHPHIIPVFDAGEADGVLYLAMRYVPGGDVRMLLDRAAPLPVARACGLISQVASALDAAHARGLVHRDVKPTNMLLDISPATSRPDHLYLSDFGLAKPAAATSGVTMTGQFLGTVDYVAPEQIQGLPVDGRADLYSLACTSFEMLCGAPPFRREHSMAVLSAQLTDPPPSLVDRRPELPAAVDAVLARALAKAPEDRYQLCLEFSEALLAACGLGPRAAVPGGGISPGAAAHPPTEVAGPGPSPATAGEAGQAAAAGMAAAGPLAAAAAAAAGNPSVPSPREGSGQPGSGQPGSGQPAGHEQAAAQPSAYQPAGHEQVAAQPSGYQPGPGQPAGSPAPGQAVGYQPGSGQLPPFQPGSGQLPPFQPGPGQLSGYETAPVQPGGSAAGTRQASGHGADPGQPPGYPSGSGQPGGYPPGSGQQGGYGGGADTAFRQPGYEPGWWADVSGQAPSGPGGGPGGQYPPGPRPRRRRGGVIALVCLVVVLGGAAVAFVLLRGTLGHPQTAPTPTVTITESHSASATPPVSPTPVLPPAPLGPASTVRAYFRAINHQNYARAWDLGGRNTGSTYPAFVNGFQGTAHDTVTILSVSGNVVSARIAAQQTDGTVRTYQGTYQVSNGVITHSQVQQIS